MKARCGAQAEDAPLGTAEPVATPREFEPEPVAGVEQFETEPVATPEHFASIARMVRRLTPVRRSISRCVSPRASNVSTATRRCVFKTFNSFLPVVRGRQSYVRRIRKSRRDGRLQVRSSGAFWSSHEWSSLGGRRGSGGHTLTAKVMPTRVGNPSGLRRVDAVVGIHQ